MWSRQLRSTAYNKQVYVDASILVVYGLLDRWEIVPKYGEPIYRMSFLFGRINGCVSW